MKIGSRWLDGVGPRSKVSDVAHRALSEKLPLVQYYLPLAACHHEEQVEFVHQLRVSTRRASTAIQMFKSTLPRMLRRHIRGNLELIRRTAGAARELDVLMERWQSPLIQNGHKPTHDEAERLTFMLDLLAGMRKKAQKPVVRTWKKLTDQGFEREIRELIDSVSWRGKVAEPRWRKVAGKTLEPSVRKAWLRSRQMDQPEDLHRFRIACKKLRYRMELTAGTMEESFRTEFYPFLKDIQQRLGEINDHVSAAALLHRMLSGQRKPVGRHIKEFLMKENEAAADKSDAFRKWWAGSNAELFREGLTTRFPLDDVAHQET